MTWRAAKAMPWEPDPGIVLLPLSPARHDKIVPSNVIPQKWHISIGPILSYPAGPEYGWNVGRAGGTVRSGAGDRGHMEIHITEIGTVVMPREIEFAGIPCPGGIRTVVPENDTYRRLVDVFKFITFPPLIRCRQARGPENACTEWIGRSFHRRFEL